jgi:hypothetical protein
MSLLETDYEPLVVDTRARLTTDPILEKLGSPSLDPKALLRFLIEYSARSVRMTEPVDSWIRRAGERCDALGLSDIGANLKKHAHHEEGHHLMLIEDTKKLVARWNAAFQGEPLDASQLVEQEPLAATQAYIDLHEEVIASSYPYGQVAIELEIEGLALSWAPNFVKNVKLVLGQATCAELSFLHEHIALDIGHTAFNRRLMNLLLARCGGEVERIATTGRRALNTYLDFLGQVWGRMMLGNRDRGHLKCAAQLEANCVESLAE